MSSEFRDGWAARRLDICNSDEDGEGTWGKWQKCCPSGMNMTTYENNARCSFGAAPAKIPEVCADPALVLWYDDYGMFCCDENLKGFATVKENWKGCLTPDDFNEEEAAGNITGIAQKGLTPMTTTSSTSLTTQTSIPTSTSGSMSTSATSESKGSSTNTGAIAGGVVGGVCGAVLILGLIWFFLRRRRSSPAAKDEVPYTESEPDGQYMPPEYHSAPHSELDGAASPQEVLPVDPRPVQELPGNKYQPKVLSELS
ncbi:unnamed protein product [Penicillium manginii]